MKRSIHILSVPGKAQSFLFPAEVALIRYAVINEFDGSRYAALFADTLEVSLENEFLPFLYPNQYVNFTPDSASSKLALSIISEDASDVDALQAVYDYIMQNLTYDYDLADTVDSGYIPDVDSTLKSGKGICFDYAAHHCHASCEGYSLSSCRSDMQAQ